MAILPSPKDIARNENKEDDGDHAIHGEKGGIQLAEIVRRDQRMFVSQQDSDEQDARRRQFPQPEGQQESCQKSHHHEMKATRDPQGAGYSEKTRYGVQSVTRVEFEILATVEDVEPPNPERDGRSQQKNSGIQRATHRDPCGSRSDAQRQPEHKMRPARKAFGVGVKQDDCQRDWRQHEGEPVEPPCGENKYRRSYNHEKRHEPRRELAGRKGARGGARVGSVNANIGQAVEGHRSGTGCHHGHHDPDQLPGTGPSACREHGAAKCEGESEDRVLPLNHFQRDAKIPNNSHIPIVKEGGGRLAFALANANIEGEYTILIAHGDDGDIASDVVFTLNGLLRRL